MSIKFFKENNIIQLTSKCNNNCVICQDRFFYQDNPVDKTFNELKDEADLIIKKKNKKIFLYGGEPFLNKNIFRLLNYLNSKKVECVISSNGRVFSEKRKIEQIKKIKNICVITSLFSWDQKIHDYLSGKKGNCTETKKGIKNLLDSEITLTVRIVLTTKNILQINNTIIELMSMGVKNICISGLIKQGAAKNRKELFLSEKSVKKAINDIIKIVEKNKINILFEKLPKKLIPIKFKNNIID